MRYIDVATWSRREHYRLYCGYDHPHFGLCANVDLTTFYPFVRERGLSLNVATVYLVTRATNAIPEFRQRIRGAEVVEHEIVHPSITILSDEELFSFCALDYIEDLSEFVARATERVAYSQEHPTLENLPGRDDFLYMTAIPWVSFTGFTHPMHLQPADSVPRFAWGKTFAEGELVKMPLAVQGHHAVMDGVHVGKFYHKVQEYLNHPDSVLAET